MLAPIGTARSANAPRSSPSRKRTVNEIAAEDWYYDPAVRGDDRVADRPGFATMLNRIAGNGVNTIIVESPD
jgi:hypothetical protein